jgi:hypothetical protein
MVFGGLTVPAALAVVTWGASGPGGFGVGILALIAATLITTGVHEAGHAVAGRLVGFGFFQICVGPVSITRGVQGLKTRLNYHWTLLGYVVSVPRHRGGLRWRKFVFTLGGPAANFLSLAPLLWFETLIPAKFGLHEPAGSFLMLATTICIGMTWFTGIVNLLPLPVQYPTDGSVLLMLLKGGPEAHRFAVLQSLSMALMAGGRPRDWDREWVETTAVEWKSKILESGAHFMAYLWALDCGHIARAGEFLDRAWNRASGVKFVADSIAVEAAYYTARYRSDPVMARRLLSGVVTSPDRSSALRAEAAILLAEGKIHESIAAANAALAEVRKWHVTPAQADTESEWIDGIIREGKARSAGVVHLDDLE